MPKFSTIKAGDVLFDVHREKMGNTRMSRLGCWTVEVLEVNHDEGWALCRWNGNAPERKYRRALARYRRSPPKPRTP